MRHLVTGHNILLHNLLHLALWRQLQSEDHIGENENNKKLRILIPLGHIRIK